LNPACARKRQSLFGDAVRLHVATMRLRLAHDLRESSGETERLLSDLGSLGQTLRRRTG
jgi:hypothetical protein